MSESTADQTRIEHDLERTRARMDSRLTELQERLSPGQVLDDLMGYFRGSEGADFARNLLASVQGNPLPAALTGIGLAWLMASSARPGARGSGPMPTATPEVGQTSPSAHPTGMNQPSDDDLELRVRQAEQSVLRDTDETDSAYSTRVDEARGKVLGIARQTQDTAGSFAQRVQDGLAAAKQSVTQGAHDLRGRASDVADRLGDSAQHASGQLGQGAQAARQMGSNLLSTLTENPVVLGAFGVAVGALLGALVPQSEREEAALGGIAGQARKVAREMAQQVVNSGGEVAQQALDAGRDSVRAQGLTGDKSVGDVMEGLKTGDLAASVKQVAKDVLRTGEAAIRKEGLATEHSPGESGPTNAGSPLLPPSEVGSLPPSKLS